MFACSRGNTLKFENKEEAKKENDKDEEHGGEEDGIRMDKLAPKNREIIKKLESIMKYYDALGDRGRSLGHRKALTFLRSYDKPIISAD